MSPKSYPHIACSWIPDGKTGSGNGGCKNILRGTYTRKLSLGFYTDISTKGLVRCDEIGGSGLYCGRVTAVRPDGFTASLAKRLHVGDTIRVQGLSDSGDGTTLSVLSIRVNDRPAMKAFSGDQCFIRTDKKSQKIL